MSDNQSQSPATHPQRWLVVQSSAVLESVATSNIACYGNVGVPRYGVGAPVRQPQSATALCAELLMHSPEGDVRLAWIDLDLEPVQRSDREIVWGAYDGARRLQVLWVWDFYRILSHVVLRGGLPSSPEVIPEPPWQAALDALRAAMPGDQIELKVQSVCGNIHQRHTLNRTAVEWTPATDPP